MTRLEVVTNLIVGSAEGLLDDEGVDEGAATMLAAAILNALNELDYAELETMVRG